MSPQLTLEVKGLNTDSPKSVITVLGFVSGRGTGAAALLGGSLATVPLVLQ